MAQTLSKEPRSFWYLNNGITIVCKDARLEQEGGRQVLAVKSPQVINGLQTTRTIFEAEAKVFGMLERGGRVQSMHVPIVNARTLRPIMISSIDTKNSRLISDGHKVYKMIRHEIAARRD